MKVRGLATVLALAPLVALCADLEVSYAPVISGYHPPRGWVPVNVLVENRGGDRVGLLRVEAGGATVVYPVEMPKGSKKFVPVLISGSDYNPKVTLESGFDRVEKNIELSAGISGTPEGQIIVVSQTSGDLVGVRGKSDGAGPPKGLGDNYCLPAAAPTRSVCYQGAAAVVLGRGAEQISDDAVAALKRYVLAGGQVVFSGGASPVVLRDPRWADVLPLTVTETANASNTDSLARFGESPLVGAAALAKGSLASYATILAGSKEEPWIVRCRSGLGVVTVCLFDVFEDPFRTWEGKRKAFEKLVLKNQPDYFSNDGEPQTWATGPIVSVAEGDDPFNVEVAPTGLVLAVFIGFILVAVPLNFVVLGKLKKREWSWTTLPLSSLLFSGMIFATAGRLYNAKEGKATQGTILMDSRSPEGLFIGSQQAFFPRGGNYDLGFVNVESIGRPFFSDDGRWNRPSPSQGSEFIDVGQVVAPRYNVPNLAFREFDLTQAVPSLGKITFAPSLVRSGRNVKVTGRLINGTSTTLGSLKVWAGRCLLEVKKDVAPGGTLEVSGEAIDAAGPVKRPTIGQGVAIEAKVSASVGWQQGNEVAQRSNIIMIYTLPQVVP